MNLFNPDVSFTDDYYEKGIFKLAWRLTILSIIVFSILCLIFISIDLTAFGIYAITLLCTLTYVIYMYKTKKTKFVFWLCTSSASILLILSFNTIMHTLHYSDIIWMVCTILFAYIGLIINELITNSMKHAFSDLNEGSIKIQFKNLNSDKIVFEYSDNGTWKTNSEPGFGEELLNLLTDQLDGVIARDQSLLRIEFPVRQAN